MTSSTVPLVINKQQKSLLSFNIINNLISTIADMFIILLRMMLFSSSQKTDVLLLMSRSLGHMLLYCVMGVNEAPPHVRVAGV